jgi:hypothetical protein
MQNWMRMIKTQTILPVAAAFLLGLGLAHSSLLSQSKPSPSSSPPKPSATLHGDAAHPAKTEGWVNTELYFGLGPADAPDKGASEAAWRDFLDKEITPRFPAGLSVVDVYGQWLGKNEKAPERIRSKMVVIDYPSTADNAARIEAIRVAWKQRTGNQSVLKVTQHADVSF